MQIILKLRFQFPHWVMKNVLFPKVITIFKLIYLFRFKMEQTLPGFGVSRFTSASASACFLSPFPGSCATWLRRSLNSKTLSTAHNGEAIKGKPDRPQILQRRKVEVPRWPKKSDKTVNSSQQWIPRRTAKTTLKSSWRLVHDRAIQTCLKRSRKQNILK